jgi:hypothetical protein
MAKYIKPTLETKFHIDFDWWQKTKQALKIDLSSHACADVQEQYGDQEQKTFDWIDPETGQVFNIDLMWYLVHTHCSQQPEFIDSRMPLTTAIFCLFVANDNTPLTPVEIYERLQKKTPDLILRTIGGRKVYKGIRPVATG